MLDHSLARARWTLAACTLLGLAASAAVVGAATCGGDCAVGEKSLAAAPSPTAACAGSLEPRVSAGTVHARPGSSSILKLSLHSAGQRITSIPLLMLQLDASALSIEHCSSAVRGKSVGVMTTGSGGVALTLVGDQSPIADGTVIRCHVEVQPQARPGRYAAHVASAVLLDSEQVTVDATARDGAVSVVRDAAQAAATTTPTALGARSATPTSTPSVTPTVTSGETR